MRFPSRELVESIRKEYPIGTRVELVKMDDLQAPPVGTKGTVTRVDDTGSLMMKWDNGSGLNVIYGEDVVRKLDSRICQKCGKEYKGRPAISRKDNKTPICPDCGTLEALDDAGASDEMKQEVLDAIHGSSQKRNEEP